MTGSVTAITTLYRPANRIARHGRASHRRARRGPDHPQRADPAGPAVDGVDGGRDRGPGPRPGAARRPRSTASRRCTTTTRPCSPTRALTRSTSRCRTGCTHSGRCAAIAAGKHVLCEKPFTSNAEPRRATVAEAAAGTGLVVMEAFHYRYHPLMARVLSLLADGAIGDDPAGGDRAVLPAAAVRRHPLLAGPGRRRAHGRRLLRRALPAHARAGRAGGGARRRRRPCALPAWTGRWRPTCASRAAPPGGSGARCGRGGCSASRRGWSATRASCGSSTTSRRRSTTGSACARRRRRWHERVPGEATYTYQLRAFAAAVVDGAPVLTRPDDAVANMTVIDSIYRAAGLEPRRVDSQRDHRRAPARAACLLDRCLGHDRRRGRGLGLGRLGNPGDPGRRGGRGGRRSALTDAVARARQRPGQIPALWSRIVMSAALLAPLGWALGPAHRRRAGRGRPAWRACSSACSGCGRRRWCSGPWSASAVGWVLCGGLARRAGRDRRRGHGAGVPDALGRGLPRPAGRAARRAGRGRATCRSWCRWRRAPATSGTGLRPRAGRRCSAATTSRTRPTSASSPRWTSWPAPSSTRPRSTRGCASSTSTRPGSRSTSCRGGGCGCARATCSTARWWPGRWARPTCR